MTVSTESAITSRDTSEKCMPSCPMAMPSETEIVANSRGYPPAACTPFLTAFASRSRDRLHGVISFHEDATPIWGFAKSASCMPTARSMPRAAARSKPSVTSRERGLMSGCWDMPRRLQSPHSPERGRSLGYRPCVGWRRKAGTWFAHLSPGWKVRVGLALGLSGSNAVGILVVYVLLNWVVPMPGSERVHLLQLNNVGLALAYLVVAGLLGIWNAWRVLHPVVTMLRSSDEP